MGRRTNLTLAILQALGWSASARAETLTVDTLLDTNPAGFCSLREAIANAATGDNDNDCAAGDVPGSDTIEFTVTGNISIGSPLNVDSELEINGGGAVSIVPSATGFSLLNNYAMGVLTLSNVTLSGASTFGDAGVMNFGDLTLGNVSISNNMATGLANYNSGSAYLNNTTISGNSRSGSGGGVRNLGGAITIVNSMITGNSATRGGGLYNLGPVSLNNTHISGNTAGNNGGAIYNDGAGSITVVSSALSNNSVESITGGGGAVFNFGTASCQTCTFDNNSAGSGGAVFNYRDLVLISSAFTNSSARYTGGAVHNNGNASLTVSNSTISDSTAGIFGGAIYNGGDISLTMSSVNMNDCSAMTTCSGGAVANIGGTATVTSSTVSMNSADVGGGLFNYGAGALLTIGDSTITGNMANDAGAGLANHIMSPGALSVNIIGGLISQNMSVGRGGGIDNYNAMGLISFNLSNCSVTMNEAVDGGGVSNFNVTPGDISTTITGCSFESNTASDDGGAIFNDGDDTILAIENTTFVGNNAADDGGAIFTNGSVSLTVENSTLSDNTAGDGAALIGNSANVNHSTVFDNQIAASLNKGPLGVAVNVDGMLSLTNSLIAGTVNGMACSLADLQLDMGNFFDDTSCNGLANGDPLLADLGQNGGTTLTHAPMPGSPLIDAGDVQFCSEFDQTGSPRGATCDVGAVEFVAQLVFFSGFETPQ